MKTRGTVMMVALVFAVTASLAVFMYLQGVEKEAQTGATKVPVVVSEQDIPAGTALDDLISQGAFKTVSVPKDTLVEGAVTKLAQLEDRKTVTAVLAGEQISTARLQGSNELPGGTLGIPDGYSAVSVSLELPRVAGGALHEGDHVTAYATFNNAAVTGAAPGATVTLVPDVEVLQVAQPATRQTTGTPNVMVTLALRPGDAQKLVFAQEQGSLWLALLPPNQKGVSQPAVTLLELVK